VDFIAAAFWNIFIRYLAGFQLFAFVASISGYNLQEFAILRFDTLTGEPDTTRFFRPITNGRIPRSQALLSGVNC
jgi:hypothetical protein